MLSTSPNAEAWDWLMEQGQGCAQGWVMVRWALRPWTVHDSPDLQFQLNVWYIYIHTHIQHIHTHIYIYIINVYRYIYIYMCIYMYIILFFLDLPPFARCFGLNLDKNGHNRAPCGLRGGSDLPLMNSPGRVHGAYGNGFSCGHSNAINHPSIWICISMWV